MYLEAEYKAIAETLSNEIHIKADRKAELISRGREVYSFLYPQLVELERNPEEIEDNGYVYVLEIDFDGEKKLHKIGRAMNIKRRLRQHKKTMLRTFRLVRLFLCKNHIAGEKHFHNYYAEFRIEGEYFALPECEVEWLETAESKEFPKHINPFPLDLVEKLER